MFTKASDIGACGSLEPAPPTTFLALPTIRLIPLQDDTLSYIRWILPRHWSRHGPIMTTERREKPRRVEIPGRTEHYVVLLIEYTVLKIADKVC